MKIFNVVFSILTVVTISSETLAATNNVFCYFGSWAGGRSGNGAFSVETINPRLCTHIAYSFIGLNTDGSVKLLDSGTLFNRFINLKNSNSNVKLLIAMGGWNEGSTTYSAVAASTAKRAKFVTSVYDFLIKYGFDGFDFDWEYPGLRGGAYEDKDNFITLLKELKDKFAGTKILSAAVGATESFHQSSYDVVRMNQYLDLINIMSYDYHGAYDGVTGQTSPLYASNVDTNLQLNQAASIEAWIRAGASPQKLLMGVALYGRSFTLSNVNNNKVGAPTSGPGTAGPYTLESGTLSYLEICEKLKSNGWTTVFDDKQKNPYSYNGNQWIGYDNVESVEIKSQYAVQKNLGGIMVWAIDYEDARNVCGGGAYPLLEAINRVLSGSVDSTTASPPTTTTSTTTKATTTTTKATTTTTKATTTTPTATTTTTQATTTTTKATTTTTKATTTTPTATTTTTQAPTTTPKATTTTTKATTTTPKTTTTTKVTTTRPITTTAGTGVFVCTASGVFRDPASCSVFYTCTPNGRGGFKAVRTECKYGLVFDELRLICNYSWAVPCIL